MRSIKAKSGIKRKRGGGPAVQERAASSASHRRVQQQLQQPPRNRKTMRAPLSIASSVATYDTASEDDGDSTGSPRRTRQMRNASSSSRTSTIDSHSSLRRNMRAMALNDRERTTPEVEHDRARQAQGDRRPSHQRAGSRKASYNTIDESEDEQGEEEDQRLLYQAPNWQLHRLKKSKLLQLLVFSGTFEGGDQIDLESITKQELVDQIVKLRSTGHGLAPTSTGSMTTRNARRNEGGMATSESLASMNSADFTDEAPSETDANDAGGEETEAEPTKDRRRRQELRRARMAAQASPAVDRRRRRGTTRAMASESVSSIGFVSPPNLRMRKSGSSLFMASSPIRTRSKARRQANLAGLRRSLPSTAATDALFGASVASAEDVESHASSKRVIRRTRGLPPAKNVAFLNRSDTPESQRHDGEWEDDDLPADAPTRPFRRAKQRAKEQMQVDESGEDDEEASAQEQEAVEQDQSLGDYSLMSLDEVTPTKARPGAARRATKLALPPSSAMSVDEETASSVLSDESEEEDQAVAFSESSETDLNASPSKMRKLRNGKLRLPSYDASTSSSTRDPEDEDDMDMADIESVAESGPMEAPTAASLGRLRRAVLIGLCAEQGIEVAADATKATLIEELLRHHTAQRDRGTPPISAATEKPGSSSTARPSSSESDDSTSTKTRRKTPKGPLKKRTTDSDKPLLLRTRSKEVQSPRPPSLKLQSGVAEPAPPADSIDELNGLDLESLNLLDKEIAPHKLEKGEKIGSGGFKDVYVGKYQITASQKRRVAIAEIRDQLSEMDIKEIKLLRDLRHENIVRFIGVSIPQEPRNVPCMVVTELCSNGDLYDYIRNVEAPSDDEIFRIMLETARGLEYLHTRTPTIIHRDVKSTNVLVSRNRTAKIADFGLARVRNTKRSKIGSLVGTVNWQAVELWSPKPNYNEKVDVWSAAMTFWEMLQWHLREKKYPFQEMNEHQIYLDVGQKKLRPPTVSIRRQYGGEIVDLLDRMWDHLAKNRPTMTEVCEELELLIAMKRSTQESQTTKPTTRAAAHHQH
ncbi:hypothetical protein L7F22_014442 [Adiantum nelumboides]|nr:hypothetical protein [Adiantum nelumboides]